MPFLSSAFIVAAGALLAQAVPTARVSDDGAALAKAYAPQWRFHSAEAFFPSSIDFFLQNVDLVDSSNNVVQANPTVQTVDDPANQGSGLYLATDIDANKNGWLKGQNPSTTPSPVYTFVAPKDNGVVDLYYWLWTPFNAGKDVPLVGRVGDHVGDWERMTVRTVNGAPTSVDYHAHSDTGSTVTWDSAPKFDSGKRPIGYIAQGSHGIWETAGTHTYVNAVIFQLNDLTNDGGVQWDTQNSIVPLDYPGTFSGDLDWLNYKGEWGNKGETDCWWHFIYSECEVVDGPTGPYRPDVLGAASTAKVSNLIATSATSNGNTTQISAADPAKFDMTGHLSQVLGKASTSDKSSYTFYLSSDAVSSAKADNKNFVAVQQVCQSAGNQTESTTITKRDVARETSNVVATAALSNKVTVTPAACASETHVAAYTIGLCSSEASDTCDFSSTKERPLRAYGSDGIQESSAIDVEDLDTWKL